MLAETALFAAGKFGWRTSAAELSTGDINEEIVLLIGDRFPFHAIEAALEFARRPVPTKERIVGADE